MKKLILIMAFAPISCFAQKLKGVVTFKDQFGNTKPDIGATVFVLQEHYLPESVNKYNMDFIGWLNYNFYNSTYCCSNQNLTKREKKERQNNPLHKRCDLILNDFKIFSESDFDTVSSRITSTCYLIEGHKSKKKTNVNGVGEYHFTLIPGKYIVLIKSNAKFPNVEAKLVEILEDSEMEFSKNFPYALNQL
jgi:hypothetical protein